MEKIEEETVGSEFCRAVADWGGDLSWETLREWIGNCEELIEDRNIFCHNNQLCVAQGTLDYHNLDEGMEEETHVYAWNLIDWLLACDTDSPELTEEEISNLDAVGVKVRY